VDDELNGKYGLEQALDSELKGKPGLLKAITDANGVPLASNKDNILIEPEPGKRVVLTIDIGIQQQLEDILQKGVKAAKSASGSALILDANSGAVKAMANYPTYDPAEFFNEENNEVFNNSVVSAPLEVGSVMKPLTMAAALDLGVVNRNSSYFDLGFFHIGDATVTNIEEVGGAATRSLRDILQLSLNTGATWMLMQMGGGEINEKARVRWHDYMTNRYMFGRATGIEQGYEAEGSVPSPTDGFGLDIQFANTSFGQGMSATPLQMGAALASIINGGNYYRPYLVDRYIEPGGDESINKPGVVKNDVVSGETSSTVREFMEFTVANNLRTAYREGYSVGGKTGTAQIVKPGGGYYDDRFNGMYIGFSGTGETQYVIVVLINEPKIAGYAGSQAAGPVFAALSNMLIDNFGASPGN
jgi:cell division protein FtsI/penicillin-binding protein 2